jgi:hypothetical protein
MKMTTPPPPAIKQRLITCFQSTGRVGKSTTVEAIIEWLNFAGIGWAAVDSDAEHRTLSRRYPEKVRFFDATESPDSFLKLLQTLPSVPVALADFPAQATEFLLGAMEQFRGLDVLDAQNIRMTVLLFVADDQTAQTSLAKTIRALGERVDYLIIKNPARYKSDAFDKSGAAEWLRERGTPIIELPGITTTTLEGVQIASREAQRFLPLAEAGKSESVPLSSRFELEHFLNRVFTQLEDAGGRVVPDPSAIKTKVQRPKLAEKQAINEFDPLNF